MATLTNNIRTQNIVNRYADYVVATANSGISWGTNVIPFAEMPIAYFGGGTGGKGISTSGQNIDANPINGATIYNRLVFETNSYTRIRKLRAKLNVTGLGGNTGTRDTEGIVYDQTAVAHMNTNYLQNIGSPNNAGVSASQIIDDAKLETLFSNLRTSYNNLRNTETTVTIDVCHASCHSSCHASRGRR